MHIQILATLATLLATGLSASATAAPNPVAAPEANPLAAALPHLGHFQARGHAGRRLSRKMHLAPRHGRHGTSTVTEYTTLTSGSSVPTTAAAGAATTTVTVYTTIYTSAAPAPTATESTSSSDSATVTDQPSTTDAPTSSSSTDVPASTTNSAAPASSSGAVIVATGGQCGDPHGTPDPSATGGPNGDENWLNCGVDTDGGWVPPPITLDNLVYKDLSTVLQTDNNPFAPCAPYLSHFETMSSETGVPTIFLASIALQESGCNPSVTGGAGEIGMMQITSEKCPTDGSDCFDAATNIRIGAQYFKTVLDQNNGNLAATMGEYNGWYHGLTVALANNYAICAQHNNLDYLQNVFNGYLQGVDPSSLSMGIYHNTC